MKRMILPLLLVCAIFQNPLYGSWKDKIKFLCCLAKKSKAVDDDSSLSFKRIWKFFINADDLDVDIEYSGQVFD